MQRRHFLFLTVAAGLLVSNPTFATEGFVDYRPGVIENALKAGKTVFVDYAAVWCTTCRAQERVISRLMKANPAYAKSMTFVRVDWDDYGDEPVARDRNIPRRSTLLVLRGSKELGRIVAGTSEADIKALLDKGL
ncbi:MAG: thioredoxin family protein [Rhizobiaceae bacterium]